MESTEISRGLARASSGSARLTPSPTPGLSGRDGAREISRDVLRDVPRLTSLAPPVAPAPAPPSISAAEPAVAVIKRAFADAQERRA